MAFDVFLAKRFGKILILLWVMSISFMSCCDEQDSSKGAIVKDIDISDLLFHCLSLPDTMVIRDDSTYRAVFKVDSIGRDCDEIKIPEVDFANFSVLIYPILNGDRDYYQRFVEIDSLNKVVTYSIAITSCHCLDKCISQDLNIVVVPKIEDDYLVKFE